MRVTRLSEGVDATGALTTPAMERSYEVLREYRAMMDDARVGRGLLVATSAVRDATNGETFLAEAHRSTGVDVRILTGDEEAAFSYAGATSGLEPSGLTTVVLDVGGGSTELAAMIDARLVSFSMQLGCVRVTERALGSGVVDAAHDRATRVMINAELDRAWREEPAFGRIDGAVRLVGLAGTVATLAQLDVGLAVYDREAVHHRRIGRNVVSHWRERLSAEEPAVRLEHPGMVRGREDVLHAGLYVLEAVMDRLGVDELLTSEDDILDGIIASLRAN
jgi:exopolyphosphatase/guanosine-5'-triphosphate,3'-diphosphate pyrophosphatase